MSKSLQELCDDALAASNAVGFAFMLPAQVITELAAERDALHLDAERYRWLRDVLRLDGDKWARVADWNHANIPAAEFDVAVDQAMRGEV